MKYVYKIGGTCSTSVELGVENGIMKEVALWGGYSGNLRDTSCLVMGILVSEMIMRLEGVRCETRSTSYPDQLCRALYEMGF